jgi:acyl-CoA reductase-like NAD-dependent aldehyde dehydrogenase
MTERDRDSEAVDFSPLGSPVPAARLEEMVAAAVRRGSPELARRRGAVGVVRVVVAWRRPVLVMSGLAAAAAMAMMVRSAPVRGAAGASGEAAPARSIAEALGIPAGYATAVEGTSRDGATP